MELLVGKVVRIICRDNIVFCGKLSKIYNICGITLPPYGYAMLIDASERRLGSEYIEDISFNQEHKEICISLDQIISINQLTS